MKKFQLVIVSLFTASLLTGCNDVVNLTEKVTQSVSDSLQNMTSEQDSRVQSIKQGTWGEYMNITVGEAFDNFFGSPKWKSFTATSGENVVEFAGYCTYSDVEVLARLQFILNEDGTFEAGALSFNDVPQSGLITMALLDKVFEDTQIVSQSESKVEKIEAPIVNQKETLVDNTQKEETIIPASVEFKQNTAPNNDYMIEDSSWRYLDSSDLEGLSSAELKIARNEIYARHGYIFQSNEMSNHFNSQQWYTPTIPASQFSDSMLNEIEVYNVDFIKNYELGDYTTSSYTTETYTDNQFTEDVIGFDLVSFSNKTFNSPDEMRAYLTQYEFYPYPDAWGDIGGINVVDGLGTELYLGRYDTESNIWRADMIIAEVPSYVAYLNDVEKICNPYGHNPMQYEDGRYYYEVEIDGVQVCYYFTPDSLREANPVISGLTIQYNK